MTRKGGPRGSIVPWILWRNSCEPSAQWITPKATGDLAGSARVACEEASDCVAESCTGGMLGGGHRDSRSSDVCMGRCDCLRNTEAARLGVPKTRSSGDARSATARLR